MNKRIRQLAIEAGVIAVTPNGFDPTRLSMSQQKFAELIVRECAKIADIADENECEWIGGNILTRFGVEE